MDIFAPESVVHFTPELIVHYSPEYSRRDFTLCFLFQVTGGLSSAIKDYFLLGTPNDLFKKSKWKIRHLQF
jgi:hypothetical protein